TENAGIFLYDTANGLNSIQKINTRSGLLSNTVRAFTYVDKNLIIASNTDILKIEFIDDGSRKVTKLLDVTEFGYKEINPKALYYLNGELWVGTGFGVLRFDYDRRSQRRQSEPRCYLVSISGLHKSYNIDSLFRLNHIEFQPAQNDFEFTLNGVNLNTSDSYYRYWLEGFDHDWRKPSVDPVITYNNLPPGKYTFHYLIQDASGNTSINNSISFEYLSPYLKYWLFQLL